MNSEIEAALKTAIIDHLQPHLDACHWYEMLIHDDELELLIQEKKDSNSQAVIIKLAVFDQFNEIHIANIFMPTFMKRQGIGKKLIRRIYEVAQSHGYSLFLVQMVQAFFDRMVNRGARIIEEGECVQITDETSLDT